MFSKFNQNKFDKQINKAFDYLNKFKMESEEEFNILFDNKNIREFARKYTDKELSQIKANELMEVDSVEAHLRTKVDKLPDGRNKWTTNNVYHLISLWLLAYNYDTHKYDKYIKEQISQKYNIPGDKITDRVNKFINETFKTDKYGLLRNNLFTYEKLYNYQLRKSE